MGIVGFGELGQFLVESLMNDPQVNATHELAFVWNRNLKVLHQKLPSELILAELKEFAGRKPDLIVEVAHPNITKEFGRRFLSRVDYMAGSPTAFADPGIESSMMAAANQANGHGLYVPRGALPGLDEVLRMAERGQLAEAEIVMRKHPESIHFQGSLDPPLSETISKQELYSGPLRKLCPLAPNNVNTMAVLAMASRLGFDKVQATLVADPGLQHHITEVHLFGPKTSGPRYRLSLIRESPAGVGAVTSTATLTTFLTSMLGSQGDGDGVHFK